MVVCSLSSGGEKSGPQKDPRTNCVEGTMTLALEPQDPPARIVGADEWGLVDGCWPCMV